LDILFLRGREAFELPMIGDSQSNRAAIKCGHRRAIHPHGEENFEAMLLLLGVAYVQPHNRTQTVLSLAAK
jgi:hypothetical protein